MNKKFISCLIFSTILISPAAHSTEYEANYSGHKLLKFLKKSGMKFSQSYSKFVKRGKSFTFKKTFYKGNNYIIAASGCRDAKNVDIYIYNSKGKFIARDSNRPGTPIASLNKISKTFKGFVKVKMISLSSNDTKDTRRGGAHFSLIVGYVNKK